MTGIEFGESPRWHDGRVWVSDWAAGKVHSVAADGTATVEAEVASFPLCFDFLPDGRMLLVSSADRALLRRGPDGSLTTHADLAPVATTPWNDIVVSDRGHAYVNNLGFEFGTGDFAPGLVVLVTPGGTVTPVADDLAFPNGMAITADGSTLIIAESYAEQLTAFDVSPDGSISGRRVWAATPGHHPDGICIDADRRPLVRRRRLPPLRPRGRRRRGAVDDRVRPGRLRLRAQPRCRASPVRRGPGLGRARGRRRRLRRARRLPRTGPRSRPPLNGMPLAPAFDVWPGCGAWWSGFAGEWAGAAVVADEPVARSSLPLLDHRNFSLVE